jgi:hypothetical protein
MPSIRKGRTALSRLCAFNFCVLCGYIFCRAEGSAPHDFFVRPLDEASCLRLNLRPCAQAHRLQRFDFQRDVKIGKKHIKKIKKNSTTNDFFPYICHHSFKQ